MNVYTELSDLVSKVMELECSDICKKYMKDTGLNKQWTTWVKNAQKLKESLDSLPNEQPEPSKKKKTVRQKETDDSDESVFEDSDIVDDVNSDSDSESESDLEDENLLAEPEPKKKAPAKKAPVKKETKVVAKKETTEKKPAKKASAKKASAKKEPKDTETEKKPRGFMIKKMIKPDVAEFFDIEHTEYNQTELVEVVAKYSSTFLAKDGSKNIQLNDELKEHLNITDTVDELPRKDLRKYIKNLYV
jgi:hypothetical protein